MPADPHAEYLARKAQRSKEIAESNAKARGVLKRGWDIANEPLWHGPQRWGREASDWLTTPVAGESPAWAMTKGAAGGALEGVGNIASGITSPVGIATTALGLGSTKYAAAAVPGLAELAASRPAAMGFKTLSGLGAGRGALRIGEAALNEDNKSPMERLGDVGTGSLEMIGGLAGTQVPLPEAKVGPVTPGVRATGAPPTGTPMVPGPHIPSMLGDVEGIRTSTSPKLPGTPVSGTRMSTVEPTKMSAGAPNLPARDISPERSAFEALVPNRYKTQMTAEGLTLNLPERFTATESTPSTSSVTSPPTTPPKAETAATSTPTAPTGGFPLEKYTDENLAAMAKRGNAAAVAEVSRRRAATTAANQEATRVAGEKALAEGKAAGKKKAEAAPPKPATPPAAPPKKPTKPAAPPPVVQEPPATGTPLTLAPEHQAMLEKLKAERAAQVATPVPGQAGVTPVPEGVTVTKVPPGASGVAEKPVVAKVKTPKVKTPIPLPGKSPLAPKPVDKWELIATDLRDQGIPEHQIADLIERGKSGQLESAPLEEVVAEVEAKSAARAAAKAPKVKVDPVRAATLKAEAKQAATIPKLEGVPEKMPSNERPLAYAKDETIEARAKQGDALAVRELGWRKQEAGSSFMDAMSATVEGAKGKIKKVVGEETGAVGPGTGKLIRQQEAAKSYRELASKDPSDPFNPNWAADRENAARARVAAEIEQNTNNPRQVAPEDFPGQHDFVRDVQDRRNRQNFDRQKEVDPEKFAYERQTAKANYPNMTNEEIDQHLFNRFAERADEVARSAAEESQGRNFPRGQETDDWGKYRPKWENPPFRGVQQLPEVTGEQIDALKADRRIPPYAGDTTERMVPNENWYAGQHGIDRAQVERMKKYGVNDPGDSADMPPSVVIDENSNYQITDGHHRSTASLETGEPVDYNVTDRSPIGWFRKNRTLRGEDSPFIQAGRAEAERGISSMDEQGASSGGGESDPALQRPSAWERLLGEETGAAGPGTGAIAREQRRNQGPPLTGAKKMAQGAFDAVNQARMTSMLSGLALPKSLLGNLGSHFTAAAETKSLAPLKALGDYKAIGSDLATGWKASENPALGGGLSRFNVPGRIMGAADHAATQSLMRSGLSEAHAKEILLTSPNPVSGWKPLNTNLGKLVVPFKTTPFNQFGEGLTRYAKHPGLYVGAAGLGAGAGMLTKDPDKLGLAMGAMGPYAVPFTVGAMTTAGARAAQGISPIPEWSIQKTLSEPQAAFTESPGLRWFEPGFGFGKDVPKDKTGSRPSAPSRPTGRPTRK